MSADWSSNLLYSTILSPDEHVTRDEVDGDGHRRRGLVDEVSVLIVVAAELEIVIEAAGSFTQLSVLQTNEG